MIEEELGALNMPKTIKRNISSGIQKKKKKKKKKKNKKEKKKKKKKKKLIIKCINIVTILISIFKFI